MPPKHWLHPQTVPRGFLRLYILTLLSRGPQTGYSIIQRIDERTEGAWKPGAGTMYPLLKGLLAEGLLKLERGEGEGATKTYSLSRKGARELEQIKEMMSGAGRKEQVMGRLFSDLLPGDVFVPMILTRYRESTDIIRQKFSEIPPSDRERLLREFRFLLETEIAWTDSQLHAKPSPMPLRSKRAG
jgi:DNA-binding PadR family transcriptional regulator